MDELDQKLVGELQKDARQANATLAKRLKVSEGTVRNRLNRLLAEGTITGFHAEASLKSRFSAIVLLNTSTGMHTPDVVAKIRKVAGVEKAYEVSGAWDVALMVSVPSAEDYNDIIEKIRETGGVESSQSLVVLRKS